jgi:TRAP-type C4-dicarboxylate transport system permease small subunit
MQPLLAIIYALKWINDWAGRIGTILSVGAIGLMVVVILAQVFFRYVLNSALPWPDEAARFLMLWLTGLMAPIALREGGMVAITGILERFPKPVFRIVSLILMMIGLAVLLVAVQMGWKHVNSGWLFASASLKVPLSLIGLKSIKIKLAYMYMSLFTGTILMIVVMVELILRSLFGLFGFGDRLPALGKQQSEGSS